MTNPNKARGTRWEVAVRNFLRASGFEDVFRLAQTGIDDEGDLHGHDIKDWAIECRDRKSISLAENVEDAKSRAKIVEMESDHAAKIFFLHTRKKANVR